MGISLRWTSADLELMPDDGKRYEIIDGELYVSKQPHWHHQFTTGVIFTHLFEWSTQTGMGLPNLAPGLIFADDDDVVPDVVWASTARLADALGGDGKLHAAPELAVEVLSPGVSNQRRDREAKLKLYSRRGVAEYWIVDWRARTIEVYRRDGAALVPTETFSGDAVLTSPLLPGFVVSLPRIFAAIP